MRVGATSVLASILVVACWAQSAGAQTAAGAADSVRSAPFLLGPPTESGPVRVRVRLEIYDIDEINDGLETFEFTGQLMLTWRDPRQAFDPAVEGVGEKVFQGSYQFNELATGWYPQLVLANESELFRKSGVVLRVAPDGTSTLTETLNASAESELDMRRFPFDAHRLEAVFKVPGFGKDEVELKVESDPSRVLRSHAQVPQWTITAVDLSVRDLSSFDTQRATVSSAFVLSVDVRRKPFYLVRLVILPLMVIVLLSFSVFWMDRASLGDRLNISFIGILTGVAYLIVTSEQIPRISYITLMHGFLNLSFLTMCATVIVSLAVGDLDKRGEIERGDRIDRRCRWAFPLVYFALLAVMIGVTVLFF